MTKGNKNFQRGVEEGYRSGLEDKVARQLSALGIDGEYEKHKIKYTQPPKPRTYTPDFNLNKKIWVETKGRFVTADRMKHIYIRDCHPELDIRFVFTNSRAKINKGSKTTYGMWCDKHGFKYADKLIPQAWIDEAFAEDKDGD